jgi:hypothetical protein
MFNINNLHLAADVEHANNLRSTLTQGSTGEGAAISQFNLQQAQNKMKKEFFKQKCKALLRSKMDILIGHKQKAIKMEKRVIR